MPFDWGDFVRLAEELRSRQWQDSLKEALLRSAVSRAYYGAFGTACEYAETYLGFPRSHTGRDHRALIDFLRRQSEEPIAQLSMELDQLRKWRNQCDYDREVPALEVMVQNAIDSAKYIINQVQYARR